MRRTNICLEDEQSRLLDQLARDQGVTRAEVIRRMLDRELRGRGGPLGQDLDAIDEAFGALGAGRGAEVPARGEDSRQRHLDRLWRESGA